MANGQHGGYRRPQSPAPVSGVGRNARRTDGGPAKAIPPGGDYGDRKQLEEVVSAAGPAARQQAAAGGGSGQPAGAPMRRPDVFAPTGRPNEPITSGVDAGAGPGDLPDDELDVLFAIQQEFPHPALARLLDAR